MKVVARRASLGRSSWLVLTTLVLSASPSLPTSVAQAQSHSGYVVVNAFPHDSSAFTQGLAFRRANLFEGTGLEGASSLRRVDLETGRVLRHVELDDDHFGEGITVLDAKVFQLTWRSGVAFVYRAATFERVRTFGYEGEGWGLTDNGRRLVMSDGTSVLRIRDPETFAVRREIEVTQDGAPVENLNELEFVDGEIFANVWPTDQVVRIDPRSGEVTGVLDLTALRESEEANDADADVTNGIAYLRSQDRLFVTGKRWAHLYEIRLTEAPPSP